MSTDETSRRGRSIVDGDTATLIFTRVLHHAPEHVWEAIATPEGLADWLMCSDVRIDGRTGGTIEMVSGPGRYHSKGTILELGPAASVRVRVERARRSRRCLSESRRSSATS